MKPRLTTSTKWTTFPLEFSQQIEEVFKQGFQEALKNGEILVEGRIYPEEIILRVGFLEKGRLKQANFEVSMDLPPGDEKTLERIHTLMDAAGSMFTEYVEKDGDVEFPYNWTAAPFDGANVWYQYNTENSNLEALANQLLGIKESDSLVSEEDETSEEALDHADLIPDEDLQEKRKEFLAKKHNHEHDQDDHKDQLH